MPKTEQTRDGDYQPYAKKFTGAEYLKAWKEMGGHDVVATGAEKGGTAGNMPLPFEERAVKK